MAPTGLAATPPMDVGGYARMPPASPSRAIRIAGADRWTLAVVLTAYLLLAVWYSVATPILEASDENWHEAVVWQIAAGQGLPILHPSDKGHVLVPAQEAGQPPLYYLLAAALGRLVNPPPLPLAVPVNPHADVGHPDRTGWNKNLVVHGPGDAFPWRGLALAVHLERLLSILIGAVTVAGVYALARLLSPADRFVALLAAAFAAFDPMLLFIAGSVDNDSLAIALSTLILVLLAWQLRQGTTRRAALLTGVLLGLAMLTKLSAAAIGAPAILVVLCLNWRARSWRLAIGQLAALGLPAAAITGWWFGRNWQLYGEPLGLRAFLAVAGSRSVDVQSILSEFPSVWAGFWGVFGLFNILLPGAYYLAADLLAVLAGLGLLIGLVSWLVRSGPKGHCVDPVLVLLIGWLVLESVLLVRWTASTEASSGRLLFPAIGSIAILFALGLTTLAAGFRVVVAGLLAIILALGAALAVPLAILPAYAAPAFLPATALQSPITLDHRYGNLELVGVALPRGPLAPGSASSVTLYWRTLGPVSADDLFSVQLHGPDGFLVGHVDGLPGGGKVLTSHWPASMGLVDQVPIQVDPRTPQPSLAHIDVYVYSLGHADQPVPATDAAGNALAAPEVGRLVVRSGPLLGQAAASPRALASFGDQIELARVDVPSQAPAGTTLPVTLHWRALRSPDAAYTVFVHVVTAGNQTVAQHDQQPHDGALPTTDWVPGEAVTDRVDVPIPAKLAPGTYALEVGLYQLQSGARLALPDRATAITIGHVTVTAGGQR